jgi:organic radical activating enzyme
MPYCNLACSWCDTSFDTFKKWTQEDLKSFALSEDARFAVITGGEPLMHKHTPLVYNLLSELGFDVAYETNGTMKPISGKAFITCSPKRDAAYVIHNELYEHVSEFKYVVDDGFDFKILDRHAKDPEHQLHSLSPEFTNMNNNLSRIIDFIKKNPRWKLSLQTHKWIGIP